MLNEEKISLMTGIAMFEKKAKKDVFPVNRYFKSDYVGSHLIRSFLAYTLTGVICLALWFLYKFEDILNLTDIAAILSMAKQAGIYFGAGLVVYLFLTWRIYSKRYDAAAKGLKMYQAKLKRLEKKYEAAQQPKDGEGGRAV